MTGLWHGSAGDAGSAPGLLPSIATGDDHPDWRGATGSPFFSRSGRWHCTSSPGILTRNIDNVVLASALTYVLLLQLVLTWALGLAAFLLDRTRVPLAVYFVIWIVVVDAVIDRLSSTDHIYRTVELAAARSPRATPSELLRGAEPAVLIAVSGGGIKAAAWASRVLTGLHEAPGFKSHVRFVSAVSGGSVGAMNFLAFNPDCGPAVDTGPPDDRFDANTASEASSLHAVGRGLVFKDLPRTVLPFFSTPSRGLRLAARGCVEAGSAPAETVPRCGRASVELAAQRPRMTLPGRRV